MIIVGIDPGAQGAIAVLDTDGEQLLAVMDLPVDQVLIGKTKRIRLNGHDLHAILLGCKGAYGFLETPEMHPIGFRDKATGEKLARQPGAAGARAMGEGIGMLRMACIACDVRLTEVRPSAWKKTMRVPADKNEARRIAANLFPGWADMFRRKRDDGRAESAILALYGARTVNSTGGAQHG